MDRDGNRLAVPVAAADGRGSRPKKLPHSRSAPAVQQNLAAKNPPPQPKQKHQVYYEIIEADNKKKKLKFEVTADSTPPPGYEFIPIGNPEITVLCKDLSRENGMTIYMVSSSTDLNNAVAVQMTRFGHHFPVSIVEEAQMELGYYPTPGNHAHGHPEPIPSSQEEINAQADAAIRDFFPRIPNTDRQEIIDHAFRKGKYFNGAPVVGISPNIPLSRRVQLAVLAHIRHNHTRYDELLRETTWAHARKTVESACMEVLVKWRGDEENGRDELETILREVVIISDTEEEEDDDDDADESDNDQSDDSTSTVMEGEASKPASAFLGAETGMASLQLGHKEPGPVLNQVMPKGPQLAAKTGPPPAGKRKSRRALKRERQAERKAAKAAKRAQRGFKRYQAAWDQAVDRIRQQDNGDAPLPAAGMTRSASDRAYPKPQQPAESAGCGVPQPVYNPASHEVAPVGPPRRHEGSEVNPIWADGSGRLLGNHTQQDFGGHVYGAQVTAPGDTEVIAVGYGPRPPSSSSLRPSSPVASRYQDLLVPSIEPPSPGVTPTQPQFIRSLPPRKRAHNDSPDYYTAQEHHNPSPSQYAPRYHDGDSKRRRIVRETEHSRGFPVDHQAFPGQQDRVPPPPSFTQHSMADRYSNQDMTAAPAYRPTHVAPYGGHYQSATQLMPQGRHPPSVEALPPPKTRENPIDLDDRMVHAQPVVVTRPYDDGNYSHRRPYNDYEIIEIRRPAQVGSSSGQTWRPAPPDRDYMPRDGRDGSPRTFAVEQPRNLRSAAYYSAADVPQHSSAPTSSEPIYIRTIEPRNSVPRERRTPPLQPLPPIMSGRDEVGRAAPHGGVYSREIYYDNGRPLPSLQPAPGRFLPREPTLIGPRQRGSPNLASYPPRDNPPRRNVIVLE